MIREFQRDDINKVADIWLDTNIKAHNYPRRILEKQFQISKRSVVTSRGLCV